MLDRPRQRFKLRLDFPLPLEIVWREHLSLKSNIASGDLDTIYINSIVKMVCSKCQRLSKSTTLATPNVKKKSEMYYGSPAGSSQSVDKSKSATVGNNGIGKVGARSAINLRHSNVLIEQVAIQSCAKSLCLVLELLYHMQD